MLELLFVIFLLYIVYKIAETLLPWAILLIVAIEFINFMKEAIPVILGGVFLVFAAIVVVAVYEAITTKDTDEKSNKPVDMGTSEEKGEE